MRSQLDIFDGVKGSHSYYIILSSKCHKEKLAIRSCGLLNEGNNFFVRLSIYLNDTPRLLHYAPLKCK